MDDDNGEITKSDLWEIIDEKQLVIDGMKRALVEISQSQQSEKDIEEYGVYPFWDIAKKAL